MSNGVEQESTGHGDYLGDKFGMWLFLLTEALLFGGMFLLYAIFRSRFPVEFQNAAAELDLTLGAVNTIILLTSSLTMTTALCAIQRGSVRLSMAMQSITVLLAMVFLMNKYFEWSAKIAHDLYPGSDYMGTLPHGEIMFYSLYYVMTGLHGLHVIIGLVLLLVMLYFTHKRKVTSDNYIMLENSGLYWHLVDLVWIYLFPLFYLVT